MQIRNIVSPVFLGSILIVMLTVVANTACVHQGDRPDTTGCELVRWAVSERIADYDGADRAWHFGFTDGGDSFMPVTVYSPEEDTCFQ